VTFGDVRIDEQGKFHPLDTQMVQPEDYCSLQSLDYIFWVQRGFNFEWNNVQISPKKGLDTKGEENEEGAY
jgi:hypothetical protein